MTTHLAYGIAIDSLDVVVVEDSRPMQTLLRSMLAACRVPRIRMFDGAETAFPAMLQERPSLVITNWRMRPASGYQLLRAIRRRDTAPLCFVPVVMMSAQATRPLVEAAVLAGAQAFLAKPFAPTVLHRTIGRVLADSRKLVPDGDSYVIEGVATRLAALGDDLRPQGAAGGRGSAGAPGNRRAAAPPAGYGTIEAEI